MLRRLIPVITLLISITINAEIKLPRLISDGMVLQRNTPVKIWGWASPSEKVKVEFNQNSYSVITDSNGKWEITLPKMKAGGPYEMVLTGKNKIILHNILIGDVWLCSGQSNMELPMRRVSWVYPEDIARANNPMIRYFEVAKKYNFIKPQEDIQYGTWKSVSPAEVLSFSAIAYFFANEIYNKYKVPVGIINSSLGGSPIEAWLSEEVIRQFPQSYSEVLKCRDSNYIKSIEQSEREKVQKWYSELLSKDKGYRANGENLHAPTSDIKSWEAFQIPGFLNLQTDNINGSFWFRKDIVLSDSFAGKPAKLLLGRIVDADSVFVNGIFVGSTSYQYPPRRYDIPANVLKAGKNTIVVRLISNGGKGGFVPDKPYELVIDNKQIDLQGKWGFQIGTLMPPTPSQTSFQWKPTGLYNAMIAPLTNYKIKGIVWYQGESNINNARDYEKLLTSLIDDWRKKFNNTQLPFIYAQLPNFLEPDSLPSESDWALLREGQLKALKIPYTGMAVTIDLGEWNDIHPLRKKDVAFRLSLIAEKIAYGDTAIVETGPLYKSMKIENNRIIISFSHIGSGLVAKGDSILKHFAIADSTGKFVWAKAIIENNKVIVWNDNIKNPVAVRYAWANNPANANLYNREGLPASPFRTDNY
jgi:sialate O-acetylesterase